MGNMGGMTGMGGMGGMGGNMGMEIWGTECHVEEQMGQRCEGMEC